MADAVFKNRKAVPEKLLSFGFAKRQGAYIYSTDILNAQFRMTVAVTREGKITTRLVDSVSEEEYVLHRARGARGAFVGSVRDEYENVLKKISDTCFVPDVFLSGQAREVIHYVRNAYHDELEFLWRKFPGNAVFRRKDSGKWYALLLVLSRRKLGLDSDEAVDILDLRIEAKDMEAVVDGKTYFPGYHMNKNHWYTICLDGSVSIEEIFGRIDASYGLSAP